MYNGVYTIEQFAYVHDTMTKWLDLKIKGKSLGDKLREKGIARVAVYGINEVGRMTYEDIRSDIPVEAFIDRRANEVNGINGIEVLSPVDVDMLPPDCYILVTPEYYFREIAEVLSDSGIREERIISLAMVVG